MSLFIVLSGFSGLKDFSLQFTNVFDSDLKIYPQTGKTIGFTSAQKKMLQNVEGIESFSKIIEELVFLHYNGKNHIAYIKVVDYMYGKVTVLDSILRYGDRLVLNEHEIVVGISNIEKLSMVMRYYAQLIE